MLQLIILAARLAHPCSPVVLTTAISMGLCDEETEECTPLMDEVLSAQFVLCHPETHCKMLPQGGGVYCPTPAGIRAKLSAGDDGGPITL